MKAKMKAITALDTGGRPLAERDFIKVVVACRAASLGRFRYSLFCLLEMLFLFISRNIKIYIHHHVCGVSTLSVLRVL